MYEFMNKKYGPVIQERRDNKTGYPNGPMPEGVGGHRFWVMHEPKEENSERYAE